MVHSNQAPRALSWKVSRVMTPVNLGTLKRCMNASHLHKSSKVPYRDGRVTLRRNLQNVLNRGQ